MHIPKTKNSIATFGLMALMACSNPAPKGKNLEKIAQDTIEITNKTYKLPFFTKILDASSDLFLDLFYKNNIPSAHDLIKTLEGGEKYSVIKNGEKYYKVYYGEADKAADNLARKNKSNKNLPNLLTVGHGSTGRGSILLSGGKKVEEGGFITEKQADSLLNADLQVRKNILDSLVQKSLKKHQKTAILSYLLNIDSKTLSQTDSTREISASFFECINNGDLGKAQSKFNITTAGGVDQLGLMKRRLVEMIIFGDGKIYNDTAAQKTFTKLVKKINKKGSIADINHTLQMLENHGISEKRIEKLKEQMLTILHPRN